MNNQQYTTGERNRYFYGKLMTARDFSDEQRYQNDKRRLGNRLLQGAGIVTGLGVLLVDSQTLSLEAGMALDYLGREIVVPDPSVKRIGAIRGFEEIRESGDAYLCIAYHETPREATFAVAGGESGTEETYNRVLEDYELYWEKRRPDPFRLDLSGLLCQQRTIFERDGITLTLRAPRYVNPGSAFSVQVLFIKRDVPAPVRFSFQLESSLFCGEDGAKTVLVSYEETEVSTFKELELACSMRCGEAEDDYAELLVKPESFALSAGSDAIPYPGGEPVRCTVAVTSRPLREVAVEAYAARDFGELTSAREDEAIYLAKAHIVVSQTSSFMDQLEPNPFRQRVLGNDLLGLLQTLEKAPSKPAAQTAQALRPVLQPEAVPRESGVLSGTEVVNLGISPRTGRNYYSHEFIHGLGAGPVAVVAAAEYQGRSGDHTLVFGNGGIFPSGDFSLAPPAVEVGTMVNTLKGTLQIGVKLLEKTSQRVVRVHWWAFKATDEQQPENDVLQESFVRVRIEPNTANLEPLQQLRFTVYIDGSGSQDAAWSVAEKNGGVIDRNGLYTAPPEDGVFEIQAQSIKYPGHRASAYVVVGKL